MTRAASVRAAVRSVRSEGTSGPAVGEARIAIRHCAAGCGAPAGTGAEVLT